MYTNTKYKTGSPGNILNIFGLISNIVLILSQGLKALMFMLKLHRHRGEKVKDNNVFQKMG